MSAKFQTIVADPPWSFSDNLKMSDVARGASSNYNTLSTSDIKDLKVNEIADPDGCILALWVPSSLLQDGLDTMEAWGFKHKQTYIWVKSKKNPLLELTAKVSKDLKKSQSNDWKSIFKLVISNFDLQSLLSFGMGRLFRQTHEIALIGTNNNKIYKLLQNKSQRSVSFGVNLRHSAKPECLQDSLDLMFPTASKLEMFARRSRSGWTCIGNEVCQGEDIRDSIKKLI
jgi:N6-adenosine-specific RNA methylase IME4